MQSSMLYIEAVMCDVLINYPGIIKVSVNVVMTLEQYDYRRYQTIFMKP